MRVLAIDPRQTVNQYLLNGLNQEGFLVDRASNLPKALWMARTIPYDIIILQIESFEALIKIANKLVEASSSTFLMALLPNVSLEEKIRLLENGLDEVIGYPCSFRELTIKMRSLLRREKSINKICQNLEIGSLKINLEKFTVERGNHEIYLRRKEFDLLYFLFRNQDRVLTKVSILEGVWDSNADVLTNTLEVHILNLRRKIDKGFPRESRLIHTIYGRGYLFGLRPSVSSEMPATAALSTN